MKYRCGIILFLLILLLCITVVFFACGDGGGEKMEKPPGCGAAADLVGSWQSEDYYNLEVDNLKSFGFFGNGHLWQGELHVKGCELALLETVDLALEHHRVLRAAGHADHCGQHHATRPCDRPHGTVLPQRLEEVRLQPSPNEANPTGPHFTPPPNGDSAQGLPRQAGGS